MMMMIMEEIPTMAMMINHGGKLSYDHHAERRMHS
jgi:hypothetical protein